MAYFNSENIVSIECREKHIFLIYTSERLRNYKKLLACFFFVFFFFFFFFWKQD